MIVQGARRVTPPRDAPVLLADVPDAVLSAGAVRLARALGVPLAEGAAHLVETAVRDAVVDEHALLIRRAGVLADARHALLRRSAVGLAVDVGLAVPLGARVRRAGALHAVVARAALLVVGARRGALSADAERGGVLAVGVPLAGGAGAVRLAAALHAGVAGGAGAAGRLALAVDAHVVGAVGAAVAVVLARVGAGGAD